MILVVFEKPWQMYNPGEGAGFEDHTAKWLIEQGIARLHPDENTVLDIVVPEKMRNIPVDEMDAEVIDGKVIEILKENNIGTVQDVLVTSIEELVALKRIGMATARKLHAQAELLINNEKEAVL